VNVFYQNSLSLNFRLISLNKKCYQNTRYFYTHTYKIIVLINIYTHNSRMLLILMDLLAKSRDVSRAPEDTRAIFPCVLIEGAKCMRRDQVGKALSRLRRGAGRGMHNVGRRT